MHYHLRGPLLNFNLFPVSTNPKKTRRFCGLGGRRAWLGTPLGALCGKLWRMSWTLGKWKRWRKWWRKLKRWWWLFLLDLISDDWWRKLNVDGDGGASGGEYEYLLPVMIGDKDGGDAAVVLFLMMPMLFFLFFLVFSLRLVSLLLLSWLLWLLWSLWLWLLLLYSRPFSTPIKMKGTPLWIVGKRYVSRYPGKIYTNHVNPCQVIPSLALAILYDKFLWEYPHPCAMLVTVPTRMKCHALSMGDPYSSSFSAGIMAKGKGYILR